MKVIIAFFIAFATLFGYVTPNSINRFRDILQISKLQAPTSHYNKIYGTKYGKYEGVANKFFHLNKQNDLEFFSCGEGYRSELRFEDEFLPHIKKPKKISATVKIVPLDGVKEFTFFQIHSNAKKSQGLNKPLLRIAYKKEYKNKKDHIWAIFWLEKKNGNFYYKKYDLGERPNSFFNAVIKLQKNEIFISINQHKIFQKLNFDKKIYCYFKLGAYLQSNGCAKVIFKTIRREQ